MLCVNNFYDFKNNKDRFGYFKPQGPCEDVRDFFVKRECLEIRRALLRYLVNRYSAYTSLVAWELWNEVDYAVSGEEVDIAATEHAMARFLHSIDPNGHMVTTSLGWGRVDYDLWNGDEIDIVQFHAYIPSYTLLADYSVYYDSALFVKKHASDSGGYAKPVLFSELGHNGTNEYNPNNDLDPDGVMLHNSIWASALSGYSGCAMHWWWDVYIDRNNLYYHYKPLASVMKRFTFTDKVKPLGEETLCRGKLRIMGIKDRINCVLWIQDKKATWGNIQVKSYVPTVFRDVRFKVGKFDSGTYVVQWIDTFSGAVKARNTLETQENLLRLEAPPFKRDIACLIVREKEAKR